MTHADTQDRHAARMARETRIGTTTLSERSDMALVSLGVKRGAQVPVPMGVSLPGPGNWHGGRGLGAFWTGPGQWMLEAENVSEADMTRNLRHGMPGLSISAQGASRVMLELVACDASTIEDLIIRLTDLDVASFAPGSARSARIGGAEIFAIRRSFNRLALLVPRHDSGHIWQVVNRAMVARAAAPRCVANALEPAL
ncbi:sarcosine oxidase subunit gamma (plasmid) [Thioclava sp. 'Guangxiensis']|uniref:sarcosine oxidase subunit gamma n=1 Tax=Thioclava sp. 'Guangxiensis' TaxID=3149044 RepID=UPI0032C3F57E